MLLDIILMLLKLKIYVREHFLYRNEIILETYTMDDPLHSCQNFYIYIN